MKFVRLLVIIFGGLLALVGLGVGIALLPSVQRWAVLKAAREVPGLKLEIASVSAGFSGLELRGVAAEKQHVTVKLERLETDFSLLAFVLGRRLEITRLSATGVDVDASHFGRTSAGAAAAGAPAAAPGLLGEVQLPFDLSLDNVRIEGRARLPGATTQSPLGVQYTVTGGKIAPGQEGLIQCNATVTNPAPGAKVTTLRAQAGLRATLTAQRTFTKINLTTVVDADGPALAGPSQLKIGADLYRSLAGENYEIVVDTLLRGVTENALRLRAQLPTNSHQYAGEWQLNLRNGQVEPFVLAGGLPDFSAKGGGKFTYDVAAAGYALQGTLQGELSRLEAIDPAWRAFGAVKVAASFDVGQQDGIASLSQFQATVTGAKPVLSAQSLGPVRYDLRKRQLLAAGVGGDDLLRVKLDGLPIAWLRPFVTAADISGSDLTGEFTLARAAGAGPGAVVRGHAEAEGFSVVRAGQPLLLKASLGLRTEATLVDDTIEAPVLEFSLNTAEGDALKLSGRLSTRTTAHPPVDLKASFSGSSARLLARWLPGAPVTAQGELDVSLAGSTVSMQAGRLQARQAGKVLFSATLLQAFSADLATMAVTPHDAGQALAQVEVGRLPLALFPVTAPDAELGGFLQPARFEVTASADRVLLRSVGPVQLADVSLAQSRRPALTGLAIEAQPIVELAGPGAVRVQTGDVTVRTSAKAPLLTFKAEANRAPGQGDQASLTFALELPALATQPIFADAQAVSAGRATGEIRAALGLYRQVEARVTLNGLVAADTGRSLPVANVGFRGFAQANGALSLQLPVLLDNAGRRSDLNFALELSPLGTGYSVDGKLTGQQVELEDLLGVLSVFSAAAAPDGADRPAVATGSTAPDTVAAWSHFSGQLALDLKSVTRGTEWAMTGLAGVLALEPTRLSLPKLEAAFGETSRLAAKMEMRFTGGPMPYRLTADYSLNDFDAGRLFKAIDPAKAPTVEGLFTVVSKLSGNGETPERALERVQGEFLLTSRQGVFRGLQRTGAKVSMTSKAVELGASVLGSIFGSEKAAKTAEKVAGQAYFVDQLAQAIGEIKFDLLSVKLSRDELLNMNLEDFSLVSPELRLSGRGAVTYVAGKDLLDQPLTASLNLAARGKLEQLIGKIRPLDGTKDELGYAKVKDTFTVGGTLAKPDPTQFFTRIAVAKLSDLLDGGD